MLTSSLWSQLAKWAVVPTALLGSSVLVWHASTAAFTASTANGGSSWAAGTVSITDDDAGAAMFSATGLKPGDTGTKCISVTYGGSLAAAVKLYASTTGTLGTYLNLTVEQGTGGSFGSCAGFSSTNTLYTGTLNGFATASSNYGTGVGAWSPTGPTQSRTFRFVYTVQDNNAAQGASATATFTWEAQNS